MQKAACSGLASDEGFRPLNLQIWESQQIARRSISVARYRYRFSQPAGILLRQGRWSPASLSPWHHILCHITRDQLYLRATLPNITLPPAAFPKSLSSSSLLPLGCTKQTTKTPGPKCSSVCSVARHTSEMQVTGRLLWVSMTL